VKIVADDNWARDTKPWLGAVPYLHGLEKLAKKDVMTANNPGAGMTTGRWWTSKRDVMADFNPKGKHDDEKTVEKQWHEKPEKRDMMIDTNFKGEYDDMEMGEKQVWTQPEQRDVMADINPEGEHDEKKMVENQVHKQPEKRDMMNDINPEGKDDEEKVVKKTTGSNRRRA
jgi:hypothetical protein